MMIQYNNTRFRKNSLKIENNIIIVEHKEEINRIDKVDIQDFYEYSNSKDEYIKDILLTHYGYCPKYLKNKFKTRRENYLENYNKEVYKDLELALKDNWKLYLSLFDEKEMYDIIIKFGKKIYNKMYNKKEFLIYLIDYEYEKCFAYVHKSMCNINLKKIEKDIDKLIITIGVPVNVCKNKGNKKFFSIWNDFIYVSILLFIVDSLDKNNLDDIRFNKIYALHIKNTIICSLKNKYKITDKNFKIEIKKLLKDTKEIKSIDSLFRFLIIYADDNLGRYKIQSKLDSYIMEAKEIDNHKQTLIDKAKTEKNKIKKREYSVNEIREKYRRKKLQY